MNFKKSPIGISITALLLSLFLAPLSQAEFLINEFLADNSGAGLTDEEGFPADWIEIHNPGAAASIAGYTLSDDPSNLTKWTLPDVVIPANGYLVIFATGKDRAIAGSELHTNFSLEASGDYPPRFAKSSRPVSIQMAASP